MSWDNSPVSNPRQTLYKAAESSEPCWDSDVLVICNTMTFWFHAHLQLFPLGVVQRVIRHHLGIRHFILVTNVKLSEEHRALRRS